MTHKKEFLFKRILLTNDDGYDAPGLQVLEKIAFELADEIWIVAPVQDQSGTSHSISIHNPLRAFPKGDRRFAVNGTPGDCVIMGVRGLMPEAPDLILSGVNRGGNLGIETVFSGTVGAAMTGALLSIPSIALSQNFIDGQPIYWETSQKYGPQIIKDLEKIHWYQKGSCLNINFPACSPDHVQSIEFTAQGKGFMDKVDTIKKLDPKSNPYYWFHFNRPQKEDDLGTETNAINNHRIAISPLCFERTNWGLLDQLKLKK